MAGGDETPSWAPRVAQPKIRALYEDDADGLYDIALIEDVGYGLWARCCSFLEANEAVAGSAPCARCGERIVHDRDKETMLVCSKCGWRLSWGDYFQTIQGKQLSGAESVQRLFRAYVVDFPKARSVREKVLLIDRLIHGFHWYAKLDCATRPVAVNLIEGRLRDVIALLDDLSYSERSTPGLREQYTEWEHSVQWAREW
jgi:ribosomal protein L37AE/L43A